MSKHDPTAVAIEELRFSNYGDVARHRQAEIIRALGTSKQRAEIGENIMSTTASQIVGTVGEVR